MHKATAEILTPLDLGAAVLCKYQGCDWRPAVITRVHKHDEYDIRWKEGSGVEEHILRRNLRDVAAEAAAEAAALSSFIAGAVPWVVSVRIQNAWHAPEVGTHVNVKYAGHAGTTYPKTIVAVNGDGTFEAVQEDTVLHNVSASRIKGTDLYASEPCPLVVNTPVQVFWPYWKQYIRAQITRVNGDGTYQVRDSEDLNTLESVPEEQIAGSPAYCSKFDSIQVGTKFCTQQTRRESPYTTWEYSYDAIVTKVNGNGTFDAMWEGAVETIQESQITGSPACKAIYHSPAWLSIGCEPIWGKTRSSNNFAFHFNVRCDHGYIAMNSKTHYASSFGNTCGSDDYPSSDEFFEKWGEEERVAIPPAAAAVIAAANAAEGEGGAVDFVVRVTTDGFEVSYEGEVLHLFRHRVPFGQFSHEVKCSPPDYLVRSQEEAASVPATNVFADLVKASKK